MKAVTTATAPDVSGGADADKSRRCGIALPYSSVFHLSLRLKVCLSVRVYVRSPCVACRSSSCVCLRCLAAINLLSGRVRLHLNRPPVYLFPLAVSTRISRFISLAPDYDSFFRSTRACECRGDTVFPFYYESLKRE